MKNRIIFIMGVSGSGKTTVGQLLAKELTLPFFDADSFHPAENIAKMKAGKPLNDKDRMPWLTNLNKLAKEQTKGAVIACSALKTRYRTRLETEVTNKINWIFLNGDFETILSRMNQRVKHYMPPSLLQSQFDTLEVPKDALVVNIDQSPPEIISQILKEL